MRNFKRLIQLFFVAALVSGQVEKADAASVVDRANFSLQETREFVSSDGGTTNESALKMSVAQVPDNFECPLFSSSPYKDILEALDGLQTAINVFPKCESSAKANELMSTSSDELRQKIIEAQNLQESGETRKLGLSAGQILSSATKLQDLISQVTANPDNNCYKTNESKNLLFSINDAFQSVAPLALDFAAKNPSLGPLLAKQLPMVAGAQAVSKGISVLESALKYIPTFDVKDSATRTAIIKNTCSFVKLYKKIEYITLDRASRLTKINQDFNAKINASREIKRTVIESLGDMSLSSNPIDAEIIRIKDRVEGYQKILARASDKLDSKNEKTSEIGTCSVIKTVFAAKTATGVLTDMVRLGELMKNADQIALKFTKTKLEDYQTEISKPESLKEARACAEIGQEWLAAQKEALSETKQILLAYDNATVTTPLQQVAKIKISREEKKSSDLEDDKAKMNILADLSVFEPGELAKRMHGMPKYLFNGPNGTMYSRWLKNGPIYDLLHDNETSFQDAIKAFSKNANYLLGFEYSHFVTESAKEKLPSAQGIDPALKKYQEKGTEFSHITTEYAPVGTYEHRELCNHAKLAKKAYVEATDHLLSNEYMCKMIEPVLKEAEVSIWLRRYCQDSKGLLSNADVIAGYKELARPLFAKKGPKDQIEKIMLRLDQLECAEQ